MPRLHIGRGGMMGWSEEIYNIRWRKLQVLMLPKINYCHNFYSR